MVQATSDVRGDRSIGPFDFNQSSTRWPYAAASSGGGRSHTQDSHRFPNAGPRPVARAGPRRDARSSSIYDRFAFSLFSLSLPHGRGISTTQRRLAWHFPAHRLASFDNRPRQSLPVTAWRHTLYGMPRKAMERAKAPLVRQHDTTTFGTGIFGLHTPCSDVLRPPRNRPWGSMFNDEKAISLSPK